MNQYLVGPIALATVVTEFVSTNMVARNVLKVLLDIVLHMVVEDDVYILVVTRGLEISFTVLLMVEVRDVVKMGAPSRLWEDLVYVPVMVVEGGVL